MFSSQTKLFISLIVGVYGVIALFGMSMMMPSEHGNMIGGGCPLMRDMGSLCETGILDHITHWTILFATILGAVILFLAVLPSFSVSARSLVHSPQHERYKRYSKDHPFIRLFQDSVRLFSDGIVQPKIFASA